MYEKGSGIRQARELAELWYSKSADQGFGKAKARIAAVWQQREATKMGRPNSVAVADSLAGLIPSSA
jgi:TPR repeat protein